MEFYLLILDLTVIIITIQASRVALITGHFSKIVIAETQYCRFFGMCGIVASGFRLFVMVLGKI